MLGRTIEYRCKDPINGIDATVVVFGFSSTIVTNSNPNSSKPRSRTANLDSWKYNIKNDQSLMHQEQTNSSIA
jgi:hypothetical protein